MDRRKGRDEDNCSAHTSLFVFPTSRQRVYPRWCHASLADLARCFDTNNANLVAFNCASSSESEYNSVNSAKADVACRSLNPLRRLYLPVSPPKGEAGVYWPSGINILLAGTSPIRPYAQKPVYSLESDLERRPWRRLPNHSWKHDLTIVRAEGTDPLSS